MNFYAVVFFLVKAENRWLTILLPSEFSCAAPLALAMQNKDQEL